MTPGWSRLRVRSTVRTASNRLPVQASNRTLSSSFTRPARSKRMDRGMAWGERSKQKYMALGWSSIPSRAGKESCPMVSASSRARLSALFSADSRWTGRPRS